MPAKAKKKKKKPLKESEEIVLSPERIRSIHAVIRAAEFVRQIRENLL